MLKKLLLTTLLLFIFTMQGALAENLYARFSVSDAICLKPKYSEYAECYILTDNKTKQQYLVLDNTGYQRGGIAITPLLKPAVYVHKK